MVIALIPQQTRHVAQPKAIPMANPVPPGLHAVLQPKGILTSVSVPKAGKSLVIPMAQTIALIRPTMTSTAMPQHPKQHAPKIPNTNARHRNNALTVPVFVAKVLHLATINASMDPCTTITVVQKASAIRRNLTQMIIRA